MMRSKGGVLGKIRLYLEATRILETMMMLGVPAWALLFLLPDFGAANLGRAAFVLVAIYPLILHIYLFNAWAGFPYDRHDPHKQNQPVVTGEVTRSGILTVAMVCLALSVAAFAWISWYLALLVILQAILWAIYAHPQIALKGMSIVPTLLHLASGPLTVVLVQGAFGPNDWPGLLIGIYFGLVLAGGHLCHEVLDHDADSAYGMETSSVRFGKKPAFVASFLVITASVAWFCALAWLRLVPPLAAVGLVAIYPILCWHFLHASRSGMSYETIFRFRRQNRGLHLIAGVWMLVAVMWLPQ